MNKNKNSQKEKKTDDKKKCFIIMPITVPKSLIPEYSGGENHFTYVLNQIFIPAIKKANLEPIPPKIKGSGLIHGEIIKNLETADLVLCDMSILNPNVFFEFGIRTSLNKPVSLVLDNKTSEIPFDTSIIHYHKYNSALQSWTHDKDVDLLSEHINESIKRSKNENSLWKYFGLKSSARPLEEKGGVEGKVDYLVAAVESLKEIIGKRQQLSYVSAFSEYLSKEIFEKAESMGLKPRTIGTERKEKNIFLEIEEEINSAENHILSSLAKNQGWQLILAKWRG